MANGAALRWQDDETPPQVYHQRQVRKPVRRSPAGKDRNAASDASSSDLVVASSEDLHRSLTADFDATTAAQQLVIRQVVADHRRWNKYQSTLARLLDSGKADVSVLERLEDLCEKASRSFHRGLDAIRALKIATTPIVVQAAPRDGERAGLRVVGGREHRRS